MSIALVKFEGGGSYIRAYDEHQRTLFTESYSNRDWDIVNWTAETVTMRNRRDGRTEILNDKGRRVSIFN